MTLSPFLRPPLLLVALLIGPPGPDAGAERYRYEAVPRGDEAARETMDMEIHSLHGRPALSAVVDRAWDRPGPLSAQRAVP